MSLEAIRQEITTWDAEMLRKLINFAVVLHEKQSVEAKTRLGRKLDDPDPRRWVDLEQLDRRLGLRPEDLAE